MKWFNKLERKFGKYAVNNLMNYILVLYIAGFFINVFWPVVYGAYFALDVEMILRGQIWRIVTFIIQPPPGSIFFILLACYLYYMIGTVLERAWGAFRFNVYFFMGVILHIIAAFFIYFVFNIKIYMGTSYLNMALFMAFATIQPNMQLLLFFVIPIKIKYLAYVDAAFFIATIIGGYAYSWLPPNVLNGLAGIGVVPLNKNLAYTFATAALVSMLNFIVFFLISKIHIKTKTQRMYVNAMKNVRKPALRGAERPAHPQNTLSAEAPRGIKYQKSARHKCAVCGRTELDDVNLEFRFCSKCEGNYEYCSEHLYTHKHVTKDENNSKVMDFPEKNIQQ